MSIIQNKRMFNYDGRPDINYSLSQITDKLQNIADNMNPGSTGIFVGFVSENQSMPTKRKDGSELKDEDYVRPEQSSTFPFTTSDGKCTFVTKISKAIYSASSQTWIVDVGVLQDTSETPISTAEESISTLAVTQKEINLENVNEIKNSVRQYKVLPSNIAQYKDSIVLYVGETTEEYETNQFHKCTETGWVKINIIPTKSIVLENISDELASQIYKVEVDSSNPDVLILKDLKSLT